MDTINITDTKEIEYWCIEFGCTEEELIKAAKEVGLSVEKIRSYLKSKLL